MSETMTRPVGDIKLLADIKKEYDYLLEQKFMLMDTRDAMRAARRSIVDITRCIGEMTGRMKYLDARYHTISALPQHPKYAAHVNPLYTNTNSAWSLKDFRNTEVIDTDHVAEGFEKVQRLLEAPLSAKPFKEKVKRTYKKRGRPPIDIAALAARIVRESTIHKSIKQQS